MITTQNDLSAILDDIQATSSKIEKQNILNRYKDDEFLKEILKFVFDPYIVSGLAKKKMEKRVKLAPNKTFDNICEVFEYLKENNSGSDQIIANVQGYINNFIIGRDRLKEIFTKDLKIGVSASTLNKVYGKGFIREHSVMLADKYTGQELGEFALSLKLDGTRCTVIKRNDSCKFFTRNGQVITGLTELEEAFTGFPNDFVFDGELLLKNENGLDSATLFRETQKVLRKDGEKRNIEIVLFDILLVSEFEKGKSDLEYKHRLSFLKRKVNLINHKLIKIVPIFYIGYDVNKIQEHMVLIAEQGLEGLMINKLDAFYECKRSKNLLKVKEFSTIDLRIIGYEEHKHKNKLGSLIVDYKGYKVNVGSGYNDQERAELWLQRDELVGKILEVKYFEETKNQGGTLSLRFPTFVTVRYDKDEVSLV